MSFVDEALRAFGLSSAQVASPHGGSTGAVWTVRAADAKYVLRFGTAGRLTDSRLAAMEAARAAGLSAPELLGRATTSTGEALLLSWLPGIPMYDVLVGEAAPIHRWGLITGKLQRRLHEIHAPEEMVDILMDSDHPFDVGRDVPGLPDGSALLHLDWHPFNLLVDDETERICGIVDWDNARRGHPLLDLARTHSMLTAEPALARLPVALQARVSDFRDGWSQGYGPLARGIPHACLLWAGRVMLADLSQRLAGTPGGLDELRRWTARWEAR